MRLKYQSGCSSLLECNIGLYFDGREAGEGGICEGRPVSNLFLSASSMFPWPLLWSRHLHLFPYIAARTQKNITQHWNTHHNTMHTATPAYNGNLNRLTPKDPYMGRTAPLTSKRCILYIYPTNIGTEYFKHALYSPFFFSSKCNMFHNANLFGSCIIHILYTGCAKIKKK